MNLQHKLGPLAHTPIVVDNFTRRERGLVHFLTHAHVDHIQGLTENWRNGRVYCTRVTRDVVKRRFPRLEMGDWHVLEIGEAYCIPLADSGGAEKVRPRLDEAAIDAGTVTVTLLDAFHCAGSAMFVFQGEFGNVLHTGDFRMEKEITRQLLLTRENDNAYSLLKRLSLDCVYVDNTYGTETSPAFPTRYDVQNALGQVLLMYPSETVFRLAVDSLGKEELLFHLAEVLNTKVVVMSEERMQIMRCLNLDSHQLSLLTSDSREGRIHMVSRRDEETSQSSSFAPGDENNKRNTNNDRTTVKTVTIFPTGFCGMEGMRRLERLSAGGDNDDIRLPESELRVPYSLHATKEEIEYFLAALSPKSVVPIVHVREPHIKSLGAVSWERDEGREERREARRRRSELEKAVCSASTGTDTAPVDRPALMATREAREERLRHRAAMVQASVATLERRATHFAVVKRSSSSSAGLYPWTAREDALIRKLARARRRGDPEKHARVRAKLIGRTDDECAIRSGVLRSSWDGEEEDG